MDEREVSTLEDLSDSCGPLMGDYPKDCWWAVSKTNDACGNPRAITILDQRLVLFRSSDAKPYVFLDRCAHRLAPLSRGKVKDDEIVCAYHGFRYNLKGECTVAPSLRQPPRGLHIRSFPALEHGDFVWAWMGDPIKCDVNLLPALPTRGGHSEVRIHGYHATKCGYSLIHENIADTEHVLYLHGDSFGNNVRIASRGRVHGVMEIGSRNLTFLAKAVDVPPSKLDSAILRLEENQNVNLLTHAVFYAPGCFSAEFSWTPSGQPKGAIAPVKAFYIWCSTPISRNTCHFWWDLTFEASIYNRAAVEDLWSKVIEEDIDIVEGVQSSMDASPSCGGSAESLVVADRAIAAIRRLLRKMAQ